MKRKRKVMTLIICLGAAVLVASITACSSTRYFVEKPDYDVVLDEGRFEIRRYAPSVVAEVDREGERYEAVNDGFSPLADYIFGNNSKNSEISMTSPVKQQAQSEKISMTSPVTQQASGEGEWVVQFTMPSEYKLEDLPEPNNPAVRLREVPAKSFAVYRFRGSIKKETVMERTEKLRSFMNEEGLVGIGEPIFAYYDPPWTLPFLRRNEVMIEIEPEG